MNRIDTSIIDSITSFVNNSPDNSLHNETGEKSFDKPLIAFSKGDDPLYITIKDQIGDFYWTPHDIVKITFPGLKILPGQLSIISWMLPFTEAVKNNNRKQDKMPSERWVRGRLFGERFNKILMHYTVYILSQSGYKAVAPSILTLFSWVENEKHGYTSNWSENTQTSINTVFFTMVEVAWIV